MKNSMYMAALVALAGGSVALAAPRESVTFLAVPSDGRIGDAANTILTTTFNGSDAGGAYTARFLTLSGAQTEVNTSTLQSEAAILITPPGGTPFIARPIVTSVMGTEIIPAGSFVIPVGSFTTAGQWSFAFFELFDDAGLDANWDTITFTLDDAAPVTGAAPGALQNFNLADVVVDGPVGLPTTRTFTAAAGDTVGSIRFSGVGTGQTANPAVNSDVNPLSRARFQLVAPDGTTVSGIGTLWGTATQSSSTAVVTVGIPTTVASAGDWTLRTWDTGDFAGVDSTLKSLTVSFLPPPDALTNNTLIALTEGQFGTATRSLAVGGVTWFAFDLPTMPVGSVVDIDTEGSTLTPNNDTGIAVYRGTGVVEDTDSNDGTNLLSAISYGPGGVTGSYTASGVRFNGRDGTASGLGAPGRYYVGVVGGDVITAVPATFQANFVTNPTQSNSGNVQLRVRYFTAGAPSQTPSATTINLVEGGAWASATATAGISDCVWFTFTTPAMTGTGAMDIDTFGTTLSPLNDTDMGLYGPTGTLIDGDDQDGPGSLSALSYGAGRRNGTGDGLRYTGQDGSTAGTAGNVGPSTTYFLAVGTGTSYSHGSTFSAQPTTGSLNSGSVTARVRAWASGAPSDPVTPPVSEALAFPASGATTSDTETLSVGQVKWYTMVVPSDIGWFTNSAVQLDNEGSTTSPTLNDTGMGVYRADATLRASDTLDGTGSIASFSFGSDDRPAPGDGAAYNGRDGALTAGTYYVAVAFGSPFFASDFSVTSTSPTVSGDVVTNLRYFAPSITTAATPPASEEVGLVSTLTPNTERVITRTNTVTDGNLVTWYRFNTTSAALGANGLYVDIDTEGTAPGVLEVVGALEDSEISLWSSIGLQGGNDDDDGAGLRSALSYGSTVARVAIAPVAPAAIGVPRDGRDGPLPAGTYYLSVSTFNTVYFAADFSLTLPANRSASIGDRLVNWRTNLPGGPAPCGPSDIASAGPVAGFDGELTSDDIIFFITAFTGGNLAVADIAGPGPSVGADGELTADDIILFINRFTGFIQSGCP